MTDITRAQVITVLKHLANGRQPDFAAQVTHLPIGAVEKIAEKYDWPDMDKIRQAIFDLTRAELDAKPAPSRTATASPAAVARPEVPPTSGARPVALPSPPAAGQPEPLVNDDRLRRGAESQFARTRALADKILKLLDDLDDRLHAEDQAKREREKVAAEERKRLAQIADLEAQIAALKKSQGPRTPGGRHTMLSPCHEPGCERNFDSLQGLNMHRRRAHDLDALKAHEIKESA